MALRYIDGLLNEVAYIPQASTQWTLAQLLLHYSSSLSAKQKSTAIALLKRPFDNEPSIESWHDDWIVLNMTMATLQEWSKTDVALRAWFVPHLERLAKDARKSVRGRAKKYLKE